VLLPIAPQRVRPGPRVVERTAPLATPKSPGLTALSSGFFVGLATAVYLGTTHDGFSTPVEAFAIFVPPVLALGTAGLAYWLLRCLESNKGGRRVPWGLEVVLLSLPLWIVWVLAEWFVTSNERVHLAIAISFVAATIIGGRLLALQPSGGAKVA